MKLKDFKFKVTDNSTGASAILTFDDLFGYEGEVCGILIRSDKDYIPEQLKDIPISYNSGYRDDGLNDNIEIEPV